ncbi:hypothetical protein FHS27_003598 [Rhodopirellula rubra]|uniref:Uncharacterized protein n=1 Tax=Aporhodopirellula rubra TaxID=980271 RepID=A0A7W5H7B4_9BACT|nr:hypothetical protein [Aporhodopirellula rubra]
MPSVDGTGPVPFGCKTDLIGDLCATRQCEFWLVERLLALDVGTGPVPTTWGCLGRQRT